MDLERGEELLAVVVRGSLTGAVSLSSHLPNSAPSYVCAWKFSDGVD